tara:strand:- start:177 stop:620 length:444 start_codon:yes stop_codon:yes gene_type:complete
MDCARIIFGGKASTFFFENLLKEKDSKYLTEFKRYFNYLKKNHPEYKNCKINDKVSIDLPYYDYVNIIKDLIEFETDNVLTLYHIIQEDYDEIYLSFKITKNISILEMVQVINRWKKKKKNRSLYFNYAKLLGIKVKEPTFFVGGIL